MSNELVKTENQIEIVSKEKLINWLSTTGNKLETKEQNLFLEIAQAYNLNPFKREIYCIPYGEGEKRQLSIITGFEVYLKRAEMSGLLDGWKVWTDGEVVSKTVKKQMKKKDGGTWEKDVTVWTGDLKACIEIFRKDREKPFYHEVDFSEYTQNNDMWGSKPKTMIKKVAMSQGFRLCFPVEIGGMPYTADELPDNMTKGIENAEIIPESKTLPEPKKEKTFKQKAEELPLIAEANGISDFAEFAKFIGISKGMPTQTDSVKLFVSDPDIYLEEIKRYHRHIEASFNKNEDDKLFPDDDVKNPDLPF